MDESSARKILELIAERLSAQLGPVSRYELRGDDHQRIRLVQSLLSARIALRTGHDLEMAIIECQSLERLNLVIDQKAGLTDRQRGAKTRAAAAAGGANNRALHSWKARSGELQDAIDQLYKSNPHLSFNRMCELVAEKMGCSEKTLKRYARSPRR